MKNSSYFQFSEKLISFDTVSSKPNGECVQVIADELKGLGFKTYIEKYEDHHGLKEQVIATIGPPIEDGLILSGHIDTVPFENQPGWETNALELKLKDDKLYGRGTCDMKLFIAQCIEAFKNIELNKLKKPIICVFTSDEEVGCLGAHHLTTRLEKILEDYPLPKKAIIGEPTSFEIINTHKGIVHFDIVIDGIGGHSSRPDLGKNAIDPLGKIIELIHHINFEESQNFPKEFKEQFPDFPYNYLHMATIQGGLALNMIPDSVVLQISYRSFPSQNQMYLFEKLNAGIKSLKVSQQVELKNIQKIPSMPIAFNNELEEVLKKTTGFNNTKSVSFATDGGYFSQMGIQCFICGPGEIAMAHKPNEYMPLEDFINGPKLIEKILRQTVL